MMPQIIEPASTISDQRKAAFYSVQVLQQLDPDVVMLVETHLSTTHKVTNFNAFQTPPGRKGGVWTGTKN